MPTYYGPSNGSGQLRLDVSWTQNIAGNYSDVSASLYYVGQWAASANSSVGLVISSNQVQFWTADLSLPTGTTLLTYGTLRHYHEANGTKTASAQGALTMPFIGWQLNVDSGVFSLPTIPRQPSVPARPWREGSATPTSLSIRTSYPGGPPYTEIQIQRATNAAFTAGVETKYQAWVDFLGLTPGTTYYFRARAMNAQGYSAWSPTFTTYTVPQANAPTFDSITPTGLRAIFGRTGNAQGGTTWGLQYSTTPDFSANNVSLSSTGTSVIDGLTPGTTYYFRARGGNAAGTGPWSPVSSVTTLGVEPPTIAVTSGISGTEATATVTPPPGSSPSSYTIEAEYLEPLPKPSGADKSVTVASTPTQVTGLIPGATYRWRANVKIGTYTSPWSEWVTVAQVNPGTLDPIYFDTTMPTNDPLLTRTPAASGGVSFQSENAFTSMYWKGTPNYLAMRKLQENLVPSEGSTARARFKLMRDATPSTVGVLGGDGFADGVTVLPSASYSIRLTVKPSADVKIEPVIAFYGGTASVVRGNAVPIAAGETRELFLVARSHDTAQSAMFGFTVQEGALGTLIDADGGMLALGRPESYFDGGTADTFRFLHEWEGAEWDSISLRHTLPNAIAPDPFEDPNCPPPPSPPRPPVPANECIPDVDIWRRYYSPLSSDSVSTALDSLPIFTITTGAAPEGPVRLTVYENPENAGSNTFVPGIPISEQVITFMPANSEVTLDSVSERAYGHAIDSEVSYDIGHMVFAADGGPATWPVLRCGMNYMLALDVPSSSPLGNVTLAASLTNRMG